MSSKRGKQPVEKPIFSSAISDGVFSFLSLYGVSLLLASAAGNSRQGSRGQVVAMWQYIAAAAVGLIGSAAGVGALRFAGFAPLKPLHGFLSGLAGFLSMPLFGLVGIFAYVNISPLATLPFFVIIGLIGAFIAFQLFPKKLAQHEESYILMTSLFGIMCVFFRACFILIGKSGSGGAEANSAAWYGIFGSALVLGSGAVGAEGSFKFGPLNFLRMDIFHYMLAIAMICLVHLFQGMWL